MIGTYSPIEHQRIKTQLSIGVIKSLAQLQFIKSRHYANLHIKRNSTPKGPMLTLPQKSTCYLLASGNSMSNYSFLLN